MEYWSRRSRRTITFLWSASFLFAAGVMALLVWLLLSVITNESDPLRYTYIVIALLPLPYFLFYLLGSGKRSTVLARRRLRKRLAAVPLQAPPQTRALQIWDWLPFGRRASGSGLSGSLADGEDPGWSRLDEANRDAKLATGSCFDFPVLLQDGAGNFLSGEIPGLGTWICAPDGLVENMEDEALMASIIHEVWHGETAELKARRIALSLYDLGLFATAFALYYLAFALIANSLPAQFTAPQLPWFALLILVFWLAIKAFAWWAVSDLFPQASCLAADDYAAKVLADPRVVARAISISLAYSVNHATAKSLLSGRAYVLSRFMFAPLRRGGRGKRSLVERIGALRREPGGDGEEVLPQVIEMNREIEEMAGAAAREYERLLEEAPSRLGSILIYFLIVSLVLGFMALGSGKNFLPVRWFLDTFSGGPNAAVTGQPEPSASIYILDTGAASLEESFYLSPSSVEIEVGDAVTWLNQDNEDHVITGKGIPTSPPLRPGGTYTVIFNHSGLYVFHCDEGNGAPSQQEGEILAYY